MAILIPSLGSVSTQMTAGEKRFALRLKSFLDDQYICWFDIPVGKKKRRPDFIILHPEHGLLVLEVKDWKYETIQSIDPKHAEIITKNGVKSVENPLEQAKSYLSPILRILESEPKLQSVQQQHKGKLCFPYGYGAVFTNLTRAMLHKMIPEKADREAVLSDKLLICKDEMAAQADPEILKKQLEKMFFYNFSKVLTPEQVERIRWHIFPEIRIQHIQKDLIFEADEKTAIQQVMPDMIKIMDLQQEQLARGMKEGHRVIHGVAGSGKTAILYYRCVYLAEVLQQPIVVLCFNISLANTLRAAIKQKGIAHQVQVYHFHGWCAKQLAKHKLKIIEGTGAVWDRQIKSVIQGVEAGKIPTEQYGAVLIDEGHDFEPEWLELVVKMVDPTTNSLLLLYDDAQAIYKKKSRAKFSLTSVGIQAKGRTTILKNNYRNTQEVLEFAYLFAKECFPESENIDIPIIKPNAAGNTGPPPICKNCVNLDAEIAHALQLLQDWHKEKKGLNNIAIIYSVKSTGEKMAKALETQAIPCHLLDTQPNKKSYDPSHDKVALMAIQSSKGLEFDAVIILDASNVLWYETKKDRSEEEKQRLKMDGIRLLYVAMTRARRQLWVSFHKTNEMAENLLNVVATCTK